MAGTTITPYSPGAAVQISNESGVYIGSGKSIEVASGASFFIQGTDYTTALTRTVQGPAASYKLARGTSAMSAATAAIETGIVPVAVSVSLATDPAATLCLVSAAVGGGTNTTIDVKLWKFNASSSTFDAATAFGTINWVAVGT